MPKAIKGIYENRNIRLPIEELPESKKELQIIVIFLEEDLGFQDKALIDDTGEQNIKEGMMMGIDVSSISASEDIKPFSITNSKFFSLPPEHLGITSAGELDEIIAGEAMGHK